VPTEKQGNPLRLCAGEVLNGAYPGKKDYVDQAVDFELCGKSLQNSCHHSGLDPLLESAMADHSFKIGDSLRRISQKGVYRY